MKYRGKAWPTRPRQYFETNNAGCPGFMPSYSACGIEYPALTATCNDISIAIMFGGSDITNTTVNVVLGQQIALTADYELGDDDQSAGENWSIGGTTVGGWTPGSQPSTVTTNQDTTTFYWIASGNSLTVTFTLQLVDNNPLQASATFNVAGPTSPGIQVTPGTVNVGPHPNVTGTTLQLGGSSQNLGIQFQASATPPQGYQNTFVWAQIIKTVTFTYTPTTGNVSTCTTQTAPPGLDTVYPYKTTSDPTLTNDNPFVLLQSSGYSEQTEAFSATMYLMWRPNLTSDIPIPLGTVTWSWSGDALFNQSTGVWALNPNGNNSVSPGSFTPGNTFPQWSGTIEFTQPFSCH